MAFASSVNAKGAKGARDAFIMRVEVRTRECGSHERTTTTTTTTTTTRSTVVLARRRPSSPTDAMASMGRTDWTSTRVVDVVDDDG